MKAGARTLRVGLAWHAVNAGNLGVGALTLGNIALARVAAARAGVALQFCVFAPRDAAPTYVTGADITTRTIDGRFMVAPGGYWAALGRLDTMLDIGAGDSFTDIYPGKRFAYLLATKAMALLRGVPLILSPQTIGPFSRQPYTALAAAAMARAAHVFARDPLSFAVARQMAPDARLTQTIDVAFAMPFEQAAAGHDGLRIGVNVSGLLYSGGYTGANELGLALDYRGFTHALIEALLARPGVQVELICHVNAPDRPNDDDGAVADALKARYPALLRIADFASPIAAKSHISGLDFLIGARMHATIAAFSTGVPVVPISYSRKFEGLFGSLGYPWLVNAKTADTAPALAFVLNAIDKRAMLATDITRGRGEVADLLEPYIAALAEHFAGLAR
jgi:colanic acid/amylovoran biosynthesis protein